MCFLTKRSGLFALSLLCLSLPLKAQENSVHILDSQGNEFYKSVGRLEGETKCTAALINTSDNLDAIAYLLTNGHCVVETAYAETSNDVIVDMEKEYDVIFNYFHDSKNNVIPVKVTSIAYSTMKSTDIALLKTDKTLRQFNELGLSSYSLSPSTPNKGETIVIAGIPEKVDALQNAYCNNGITADVVENYWHWDNVMNNTCGGISAGSSGSPVFNAQKYIIGIINTTNFDSVGETCYSGNPCAIGQKGAILDKDHNYVIPTSGLLACFNKDGQFNLSRSDCVLPKPSNIEIEDYPYVYSGINAHNKKWNFKIKSTLDAVRTKMIKLDNNTERCNKIEGYSAPINPVNLTINNEDIPIVQEGVIQYCVIAANNITATYPEIVQVIIDNTAPTLRPEVEFSEIDEKLVFEPKYAVPELVDFWLDYGPQKSMNCSNADYVQFRRNPIVTDLVPTKLCLYGLDSAGNKGEIFEYNYSPK